MGPGAITLEVRPSGARCSGCGWSAADVHPAVPFVGFGQRLFRGVVRDPQSQAVVERIEDLTICGECVAAMFLLDPEVARKARERVTEERRRLQGDLKHFTARENEVRREIRKREREIERRRAEEKERDEVRVAAVQWSAEYDATVERFCSDRLNVWKFEKLAEGDGSPEAAKELEDASEQFEKLRRALRFLMAAGRRLEQQCEDKNLVAEHAQLRDRLAVDLDPDSQSARRSTR